MMTSSPLSNIDDDCLFMIFDIMTRPMPHPKGTYPHGIEEDHERPLNTIRTASQVCRRWRVSLISSPWIWGRIIDLDVVCLGKKRFHWLAEVLRRAGSEAVLWITGNVFNTSNERNKKGSRLWSTQKAFIYLLDSWERIEKLDVDIQVIDDSITEIIQNRFLSRAPNLKLFSVGTPLPVHDPAGGDIVPNPEWSQNLFANYAPLLRITRIRTNLIGFRLDASWLSNITQMVPIPRQFNLNDVFVLLHRAPMLEDIEVIDPIVPASGFITLPIHLPNLTSIDLMANLEASARFLDLLRPGRRLTFCSIRIINAHFGPVPEIIIPTFKRSVPKLISNYFTANALVSTSVKITVHQTYFEFSARQPPRHDVDVYYLNPQFLLNIDGEFDISGVHEQVKAYFVEAVAIAPSIPSAGGEEDGELFGSVDELTLSLQNLPEPYIVPSMYAMLAVFQHIQHLTIHEHGGQTLCTISRLDQIGDILFPELHTLHFIPGGSRSLGHDRTEYMTIACFTEFLVERKRRGFPVRRLDLTAKGQYRYVPDFRELEQVDGLEVVWREKNTGRRSYICGSGDPEQLKDILDVFQHTPEDIKSILYYLFRYLRVGARDRRRQRSTT